MGKLFSVGSTSLSKITSKTLTFTGQAVNGQIDLFTGPTAANPVLIERMFVVIQTTLSDTVDGAEFRIGLTTAAVDSIFMDTATKDLDLFVAGKGIDTTGNAITGYGPDLISTGQGILAIKEKIVLIPKVQTITGGVLLIAVQYTPLTAGARLVVA